MTEDGRLDLLALRLAVAGDQSRLRPNTGLEIRVVAGQLAELALAGVLIDYEGSPAIVSTESVADGALDPLRDRVAELAGWRWDQLFWRQGIYAKGALEYATHELIDDGVWLQTATARPWRPARFADTAGAELRELATRLDDVIKGRASGTARERILVALNALLFNRRAHAAWMDEDWTTELRDLTLTESQTVQRVIEAANLIAATMIAGGAGIRVDAGGA